MESKSEKAFRIADLIVHYREGTLPKEEQAELQEWLQVSLGNQRQLEELNNLEFLRRKRDVDLSIDTVAAYTAFRRRIAGEREGHFRTLHRLVAVAAVLVVAWGGYWSQLRQAETRESVPQTVSAGIPAGGTRAVLTLANGERIRLDGDTTATIQQLDGTVVQASAASLVYRNKQAFPEKVVYNTLNVPRKGEFMLVLSDGTEIWLNSESEVEYPTVFLAGERRIRLRGEAYLQVASKSTPFIVETGNVQVQVLGTAFNLRAYPEEEQIQATLVEGSVAMSSGSRRVLLKPSEQGCADVKTGRLEKKPVDIRTFVAWKDGRFVFEGRTLEEIMKSLSRWYDVDVAWRSDKVRKLEFTGNLRRYDDFNQIVSMLALACPAKFDISGNTIYISE